MLAIVLAVESLVHFAFEYANVGYTFPVGITKQSQPNKNNDNAISVLRLLVFPTPKVKGA